MTPRSRVASALIIGSLTLVLMAWLHFMRAPRLAIFGIAVGASSILVGRVLGGEEKDGGSRRA